MRTIPCLRAALAGGAIAALFSSSASAATDAAIDGAQLSPAWVLPFGGILASLALFPAALPHFWHRRQGAVSLFWALAFLIPFALSFGAGAAAHELLHAALLEYIPFIALIGALFTIAGGIHVGGNLHGSPSQNLAILLIGTALASFAGTTGAAMILIRPLIRANKDRRHKAHVIVFFIFLVCNIGGALTPLGDPPLFLGYLQGVDFSWPARNLWPHTLIMTAVVAGLFFALDCWLFWQELPRRHAPEPEKLKVRGRVNVALMALLVATIVASGADWLGAIEVAGVEMNGMSIVRDAVLVGLAVASLALTPRLYREQNEFDWAPVLEVAKLFAAIFITIIPAVAILKADHKGAFASIFTLLETSGAPNPAAYLWLTGALSSFLDNAPTYLVFFNAAGGDAKTLMGPMAPELTAISCGAVFMGAMTYIGNAPNFMVKAIAESQGVKMPGFFGFLLWSYFCLLPPLLLLTVIFFR